MIFVTIGTQLPFPRLVDAVAGLAPELAEPVIAQIGPDETDRAGITQHRHLAPDHYGQLFQDARVVVAHAGIGTILQAKAVRKPLVVLPRRADLGEHRNDHQQATAKQLQHLEGIHVAWEVEALRGLLTDPALAPATPDPGPAAAGLIAAVRQIVDP